MEGRIALAGVALFIACVDAPSSDAPALDPLAPKACAQCHPDHYLQWSGSMHAYASSDPLFVAMNARAQRETEGAIGDFCVNCHAPMAVRAGLLEDPTALEDLEPSMRGITCVFCHTVEAVEGPDNNQLSLGDEYTFFGSILDPLPSSPHASAASDLHNTLKLSSSAMCGACHDVVTPAGVHVERTYKEWQASMFAGDASADQLACGRCHMNSQDGLAAEVADAGPRIVHDHSFPGVDQALTDFPQTEEQAALIASALEPALVLTLCVLPSPNPDELEVTVDLRNRAVGHGWPSGANQHRRAWVELIAREDGASVWNSGVVAADQSVSDAATADPNMWVFRDRMFDEQGEEVHMLWEAASYETNQVPAPLTGDSSSPDYHISVEHSWTVAAGATQVDAVVKLRSFAREVAMDLVESGDLDPSIVERLATLTLDATAARWVAGGDDCIIAN